MNDARHLWQTPPARHADLAPVQGQRADTPLGAIAVACFLLALVLAAVFVPDLV